MVRFVTTLPTHNRKKELHFYQIMWGTENRIDFCTAARSIFPLFILEYIEESTAHILECTSLSLHVD